MLDQIVTIYCICDETTKSLGIKDDNQCKMTSAEVMTFAIFSALIFNGDYKKCRLISIHGRYFPTILSHSRIVRRVHQIPEQAWVTVFLSLKLFLHNPKTQIFVVDSFPVKAYENCKHFRARIFSEKKYHGYSASKKQYFFGIKVHMVIDAEGIPIEFTMTPGSHSDIASLRNLTLALPQGAVLLGDAAYTDYKFEDMLKQIEGIHMLAKRRKNLKRQHTPEDNFTLRLYRNRVETVFSSIVSRMPRYIRARTEKGFYLKVYFFILAYMMNLFIPIT